MEEETKYDIPMQYGGVCVERKMTGGIEWRGEYLE